jgi:hypothetical protein
MTAERLQSSQLDAIDQFSVDGGPDFVDALERIDHHVRLARIVTASGMAVLLGSLFFLGWVSSPPRSEPTWLPSAFISVLCITCVVFVFSNIYSFFTVRCPWCRGGLSSFGYPFLGIDRVRFCPNCGKSLDVASPKKHKIDDELA